MSNKAIIIALLLALGLGGVLIYTQWRSGPGAPGAARDAVALPINPADIVGVAVKTASGERAVKREASGGWVFAWSVPQPAAPQPASGSAAPASSVMPAPAVEGPTWPVDPTPVQDLLRSLADLKPNPQERGGSMPSNPVLVSLTMRDGSMRFVRISPSPVGGRTLVDIDGKAAFNTDASILKQATEPGPAGWRVMRALPTATSDLTRLTVISRDEALAFSKQEGRWFLSRPVSARTSAQGVGTLLDGIGRVAIEKFIEDSPAPDTATTGLNSPRMIITAERESRTLDASGTVVVDNKRRDVFIGAPADAAGNTFYASSDPSGTPLFIVNASALTSISTAARTYLDVTASGTSPADVGLITVKAGKQEVGFRRQNGAWYKMLPGGKTEKKPVDSKQITEAIEFFTTRAGQPDLVAVEPPAPAPSGTASAGKKPADPKPAAPISSGPRVTLLTDDGREIDTVTMGYTPDGTLAAKVRDVLVTYPGAQAPKILSMSEPKPAPGAPAKKKAKSPTGAPKK